MGATKEETVQGITFRNLIQSTIVYLQRKRRKPKPHLINRILQHSIAIGATENQIPLTHYRVGLPPGQIWKCPFCHTAIHAAPEDLAQQLLQIRWPGEIVGREFETVQGAMVALGYDLAPHATGQIISAIPASLITLTGNLS